MQHKLSGLSRLKLLFVLGVTAVYSVVVIWLDFLQGPMWGDEVTFWHTSVALSDRLLPTFLELKDYTELNTPLPFIIFGALEHVFSSIGITSGRLLNLVLSVVMVFVIGWPTRQKQGKAFLCIIGLLLCPYYLWLSGRLYTEMIACFCVLLGFMGYVNRCYGWSCVAFALAIAARQYMVAFPAAIALYEFLIAASATIYLQQICLAQQWKWLAYTGVTITILGWLLWFGGLAPQTALDTRPAPEIQHAAWAIAPGVAINFLSSVGLYLVVPEFLLFGLRGRFWLHTLPLKKILWIAIALLLYTTIFPPHLIASGNIVKLIRLIPYDALNLGMLYSLALFACIRFFKPSLMGLLVLTNSLVMMKAHPWDRYVLPLVVVFWYIKANGLEEQFALKAISIRQRES